MNEYDFVKPPIEEMARSLMDQYVPGLPFGWNRGKVQMGVCFFDGETLEATKIELSQYALDMPFDEIHNLILHEIAHAIAGHAAGHNAEWRAIARSIGCSGDRCCTVSPDMVQPPNYMISCDTCGWEHPAYRVSAKKRQHVCKTCYQKIRVTDVRPVS